MAGARAIYHEINEDETAVENNTLPENPQVHTQTAFDIIAYYQKTELDPILEEDEPESESAHDQQPVITHRPQPMSSHSEETKALLERFREKEPYRKRNDKKLYGGEDCLETSIPASPEPITHSDTAKALLARFKETDDDKGMIEDEISAESAVAAALGLFEEEENSPFPATAGSIKDMECYLDGSIVA